MVGRGINFLYLNFMNLIFELKSLNFFARREDPIEFY